MKVLILSLIFMGSMATSVIADCVGEIQDIKFDVQLSGEGLILVSAKYSIDGNLIDVGNTRYVSNIKAQELKNKIDEDIKSQCEALMIKSGNNVELIKDEMEKKDKQLSDAVIATVKDDIVGRKIEVKETILNYKGKDIHVKTTGKNSADNINP